MKLEHWRRGFFSILLVFCIVNATICATLDAQPVTEGIAETERLYALLQDARCNPVKQAIVPADDQCFPQNILVTIPATEPDEPNKKEPLCSTVIFSFTQQFALDYTESFFPFLDELTKKKLPYTTVILLSADDESILPDSTDDYHPGGTASFTASVDNPDSYCAIVIERSKSETHEIVPGGGGDTAPSWLVQTIKSSCAALGQKSNLSISFITLYRNGILRETKRVSSFLSQGIAAAGIYLTGTRTDFKILSNIADRLVDERSDTWDRHYSYIPFAKDGVWIGESFFAISYLLIALVSLFILCFFSFIGKTALSGQSLQLARTKDVLRLWYLIPVVIICTTIILLLIELPFPKAKVVPVFLIGLKLLIVFLITAVAFVLQLRFSYRISSYACSFLMNILAVANIFIFTTIDLSLVFLFFFEYLLVLFAGKMKSIPMLIVTELLMMLPFIPYISDLLRFASPDGLVLLSKSGFTGNLVVAFAIFPFQVQFQRILIACNLFSRERHDSAQLIIVRASIVVSVLLGTIALLYFAFTYVIVRNNLPAPERKHLTIEERKSSGLVQSHVSDTTFMELTARHLIINSNETILRYLVSVTTPDSVPLYDCNYDYLLDNDHTAYFELPDYPTGTLEIIYSTNKETPSVITIESYIAGTNNSVYHETMRLSTKGVKD